MNLWKLLWRSLAYYRKTNLWVVLGTLMSTAILVGALVIGDSVRHSLQQIVFDRLGTTEFALSSEDRFFEARMADDLSKSLGAAVAPLLQTRGIAIAEGGQRRVNSIQVVGVDARFGEIGGAKDFYTEMAPDEVIVNRQLAERLGIVKNNEILLRFQKLDVMPRDAPLSLDSESTVARRFRVRGIASDSEFGRFNLKADQVIPSTAFVSLFGLSREMGFAQRANVLLVSERQGNPLNIQVVEEAAQDAWTLADSGLELREIHGRTIVELRSSRVFLDPSVVDGALSISESAQPILTYFVNELRRGERSTPYSFISAPGAPVVPHDMKADEIIINEWLARDLRAGAGDKLRLTYYRLGSRRNLEELSSDFRVKAVVPLRGIYADKDLLPDFPGLAGEANCRDWKPGIPIDLDKIRDKDEDYWDDYGGTPKAFVTLAVAQRMWANRFGNVTSVRFSGLKKDDVQKNLKKALDPSRLGFVFRDLKEEGLRASSQSVSFAQLFLGLSFFIIIAALLLTSLLFVFNTENRAEENGLFLALGFSTKAVRGLVLREAAILVVIGSLLGSFAGILYNLLILKALETVWRGAVGTSVLHFHFKLSSIFLGASAGMVAALFTIWLVTRRQVSQSISGLQKGLAKIETVWKKKPGMSLFVGISSLIAVMFILVLTDFGRGENAFAFFFIAGFLLLVGGMAMANVMLYRLGKNTRKASLSPFHLGARNNARKRMRSITLIGLLACGVFIVFTVGANRINALKDADKRDSGTGGFALYGESSIPVLYDLNSQKGKQFYGLESAGTKDVSYVQLRLKEGDDASCLNLNRVSTPQLIGIDPEELGRRGAFTFAETTDEVNPESPWSILLTQNLSDGIIPAVADQSVIVWGLGKAVGDSLTYLDEKGETFQLKLVGGLANSIFQGKIIISEKAFIQKFPSISGYRLFLVDTPLEKVDEVRESMSWALQDQGLDLIPASTRLAEFNTVQNTYLSIFLILGSFGLLLGSVGLGIVVWRNVKERQGELALLRAVGFTRKSIQAIILSEHITLLVAGIFYGILAALLATLPSLLTPGAEIPYLIILIILIIIGLNGTIWTYSAAYFATKKDLIPALRKE
jgi:putative ABC transport system permease protein